MVPDITPQLAQMSLRDEEHPSSASSQQEDATDDTPNPFYELLLKINTNMPSQPKEVYVADSVRSQSVRTPWDGKRQFKPAQRSLCVEAALKQLPSSRLPMYMDPFLIVAPVQQLVRAWYGIPVIDPLILKYAAKHQLVQRLGDDDNDGDPVFEHMGLARFSVLEDLGQKLGVRLNYCGLDEIGRKIATLLDYPPEESNPQWCVALEQEWKKFCL
ncbi:hypothetical protein EIP91_004785 [Steccherinum ochraceum]|uniref:Uncharacterized protein n=1 Tax=Steccherinum ochraceum TaxID=92696 RepID=A0A4R0RAR5_9APHY|nr:hypothetical protein EIP91_004785 [Steccherinum ochraceum]